MYLLLYIIIVSSYHLYNEDLQLIIYYLMFYIITALF